MAELEILKPVKAELDVARELIFMGDDKGCPDMIELGLNDLFNAVCSIVPDARYYQFEEGTFEVVWIGREYEGVS